MLEQTNLNSDGTFWLKTTPDGKRLVVGNQYCFNGKWWVYVGDYNSQFEAPNINCCYTVGNRIYTRTKTQVNIMPREKIKRKRADDGRPINTDINDEDGGLLVLMKTALKKNEVTRSEFKQLYDNDSDMNNSLKQIESGNSLSWKKFTDLADRMHLPYKLQLFNTDGSVIETYNSDGCIGEEKTPKKRKTTKNNE